MTVVIIMGSAKIHTSVYGVPIFVKTFNILNYNS